MKVNTITILIIINHLLAAYGLHLFDSKSTFSRVTVDWDEYNETRNRSHNIKLKWPGLAFGPFNNVTKKKHGSEDHDDIQDPKEIIHLRYDVELSHRVEDFVVRLKTFINDTCFDVLAFDRDVEELTGTLEEIELLVFEHGPSRELSNQITFANHMFHVMIDSSDHLKKYMDEKVPGHWLLYKIIELNVRILALHNSHGELDTTIDGYVRKLLELHRRLFFWGARFRRLTEELQEMDELFKSHVVDAELTLEILWDTMPRKINKKST